MGYQAYSILKTGKDYSGQRWPLSFHSIADWRTPLFLYSTAPFVAVFGLNEWGVRLPAAIFGILTLPVFFLLVRKLFKKDEIALLGTFFLSISIWHLQYSRASFEVTQMLFLLIGGIYLFLKGMEKWPYLLLADLFLALSPYSYNTAKLFLPVLVVILIFCFSREIKKIAWKKLVLVGMVFVLFCLPIVADIFLGKGSNRFSILSIFTDPTTVPQIGFDRQVDMRVSLGKEVVGMRPSLSARIFHNKFLSWGTALLQNYFRVFSTDFLFIRGDINFRHSIQGGFGQFYWSDIILLILGFFFLLRYKDSKIKELIFVWLFLAPLPSSLTREGGTHATRLILMLPPCLILTSLGSYYLFEKLRNSGIKKYLIGVMFLVIVGQFSLYLHRYYVHYPLESENWWHYGFKELADYVKGNEYKYDYVIWSDRDEPPLIFSAFWLKINPQIFQEEKLIWTQISDAIWANYLPKTKYYYGHVSEERITANGFVGTLKPNILYLLPKKEIAKDFRYEPVPNSIKLLKTVYSPSGAIAKYILTGL